MAFNPFEVFSIRSKIGRSVMAVLGIVVMLTFVLSTGAVGTKNDFFDQIGSLFGGKGRGEVLVVAYGDDIRDTDLIETRKQREAANAYLREALDVSYNAWARKIEADVKGTRLSAETKRDVEKFISLKVAAIDEKNRAPYEAYLRKFISSNPQFGGGDPETMQFKQAVMLARLKPDSEDKSTIDAVVTILLHDLFQMLSRGERAPLFAPLPDLGVSDNDLVNFILLQKKADQLGIKYSQDAVVQMVQREAGGHMSDQDSREIFQRLRNNSRSGEFSYDWLMTAVGNEFRGRMALTAIEGQSPAATDLRAQRSYIARQIGIDPGTTLPMPGAQATASALPGELTPYEFWEFYRDRCSEHTFAMLEVPVENFIDQVNAKPTDKELKDLFLKYRGELPDPSKDRPGFKEPKKVQVQYVTLDANAKRITDAIPKVHAANVFLAATTAALSGSPASALTAASGPAIAESLPVKEAVREKMDVNLSRYGAGDQYFFNPRDVSIYRPQPIMALLAGFAGTPSIGGATAPVMLMFRHVEQHDVQTRVPFLLQSVLTPFTPTLANAIGMPAFAYALNPKLPPEAIYLPEVLKEVKTRQRRELFEKDARQLQDKLREITKDAYPFGAPKPAKDKLVKANEEAAKYLESWLKERGLTPAGTKKPIDEYSVSTDPELKPLYELATKESDGTNSLTQKLFGVMHPQFPFPNMHPFQPEWFPGEPAGEAVDKPGRLMWTSEEQDPRTYNSLANADSILGGEAMTKRVERAWKMEKARAIAQDEANRLADQVRAITKTAAANPFGVEKQLRDLAAEKKYRLISLERLAVLKFDHSPTKAAPMTYKKSEIEKDKVQYPTDKFVDQLLELRKQPLGAVTVETDAPRARLYVAAEVERQEKTIDQFRSVFSRSSATGLAADPLYLQFALPEERGKAIDEVFARLRAEAKFDEKDAFKKREKRDSE
jgi:hypothetical protein